MSLRVNDLKQAREFYGDVLGFDIQDLGKLLYFTVGSTFVVLWPPNPGTPNNDRVIDTRVGLEGPRRFTHQNYPETHIRLCPYDGDGCLRRCVARSGAG